jgi:hypothetical protein
MIHEFVLCTISFFLENIRFESYNVENSNVHVMAHRERKFQYRLPVPNNIVVTLLIKEMRDEKKQIRGMAGTSAVCVNSNQLFKGKCRSRNILDDTLHSAYS